MPIIAVMTGEGQKKQPVEVTRETNRETEIVTEKYKDGSVTTRVEGPFHVNNVSSSKERFEGTPNAC